ncbi:MAG: hypothetical protein LWY06_04390 [Firmicutes bacterium]|nr:hypothetical protein [Bacillota bacterium]
MGDVVIYPLGTGGTPAIRQLPAWGYGVFCEIYYLSLRRVLTLRVCFRGWRNCLKNGMDTLLLKVIGESWQNINMLRKMKGN